MLAARGPWSGGVHTGPWISQSNLQLVCGSESELSTFRQNAGTPRFPTHCFYWKYFNLYVYVCMSIEVCSHECGWPLRPGQRASDSLGVVNYPIWVVGSVLRSSKRGVYTLNYWSHLSSPHIYFKILVACDLKLFLRVKQNTITRQRSSETLKSYLSW